MAARIDLAALQRQLDGFQAKFQAWAQHTVAGAEALRDSHLTRLREFQGALPAAVHGGWGRWCTEVGTRSCLDAAGVD